jgi:hypothetical protein
MKYIITESQHNFIKRRYSFIRQLMDRELVDQEPCYYKYYGTGFNSYKRAVLEGVTEFVMQEFPNFFDMDEGESDEKWYMIHDSLEDLFSEEIEDYYDNADCSEYEEGVLGESSMISELDRHRTDSEYEEQYERIKGGIIKSIKKMMKSYGENDDRIIVYGDNKQKLMSYLKKSRELYYDRSISDIMENTLPHPIWFVNGRYIMSEVFESFFPHKQVKRCSSANIV